MAVWGIGAYYKGDNSIDKTQDFINQGFACIGWEEKDAPALYQMIKSVKTGDIIYIKSFTPNQKQLYIKAVGIVTDNYKKHTDLGYGVKVKWKKDFNKAVKLSVSSEMYRNNVFSNTLYEEYNENIISQLVDIIMN